MFISFIAFVIYFFDAKFVDANLFGVKLEKPIQIIYAIFLLHLYFYFVFCYMAFVDTQKWVGYWSDIGVGLTYGSVIYDKPDEDTENKRARIGFDQIAFADLAINKQRNILIDSYPPAIIGLLGFGFLIGKISSMSGAN